jgi:hypothetical protein
VASLQIQERVDIRLLSFATPTIMTSPVVTVNYVAPPAPTVNLLTPFSGPEAGGTSVAITGTNLSGASAVTFGTFPAASFTVNSATSITAVSPAGTGTVNVRVTTGGGTSATGAGNIVVYIAPVSPPTVTSVSPNTGPATGGTSVTITGTNFTGTTAVSFGATAATGFTVNSATSITATSPAGTGTVDVRVTSRAAPAPHRWRISLPMQRPP